MKILAIVMVAVGILCLIGTIMFVIYLKKIGKSIFEMQATLDCDEFTITEKGSYAIWFRVSRGIFAYPRLNVVVNEVETVEKSHYIVQRLKLKEVHSPIMLGNNSGLRQNQGII